ncbi:vesicle-fusing ATPase-like [Biomphalaria glabrata]|uniref:Vesicle-fusing ATPase n=3 Tax=Biomphalaria glabrata TaxID=6526 RepID=A0A9W2Z4E8_BIOGL|nr:vesicle-fusing ATPase-like [Biomphalaria glabrata]XP_055869851.1 vesicle-fusing ATPase-like [Biomphalaria glabrata]KAI8744941.1 vesicle-fusing ATPase isoform X2 [Biomphalaria glabrata]
MSKLLFKAVKCPSEDLSITNAVIVNEIDFQNKSLVLDYHRPYVSVTTLDSNLPHLFTLLASPGVKQGQMGFNAQHRKWASIMLNADIRVEPRRLNPNTDSIAQITLETDFLNKKNQQQTTLDSDKMAAEFSMLFVNRAFTVEEPLVFKYDKKLYSATVKNIEVMDFSKLNPKSNMAGSPKAAHEGFLTANSVIVFEKVEGSLITFTGKSKGKTAHTSIINPDWDFTKLGIGGLDDEFSGIFRRAFASRVFPPEVIEQLGMKHVRGILLYGPPGTGKTLMARQIGKMLNAREPQIVNGPQILDKYVGESEANIRKLFAAAEEEEKRSGAASGLHIIIFDEIDAICKARGSVAGNSAVHDTVVNQLLTKLDGVEQLNNILVIGMTNRKDMIDEALTRPGRLEVQMEIGLPDEHGRVQILNIHTETMRNHKKLADDVDISELASLTKNFSGAEIEGLVRAAQSTAMNRLIKATSKVEVDTEAIERLKITRADFLHALQHDIKPAFGSSKEELDVFVNQGILSWGEPVSRVLSDGELVVSQIRNSDQISLMTLLLEGPPGAGKTALAAKISKDSDLPFLKLCTPENMIGYTEAAKCQVIKKIFDDAYKSPLSCIVIDDIERLLDYVAVGPRFSNLVLQAMLVLLKKNPPKGHKLLIIGTTSRKDVLQDFEMLPLFKTVCHVSAISSSEQLINVLQESEDFTDIEISIILRNTTGKRLFIGIKTLLTVIDMAKQMEKGQRAEKFIQLLEDLGAIDYTT